MFLPVVEWRASPAETHRTSDARHQSPNQYRPILEGFIRPQTLVSVQWANLANVKNWHISFNYNIGTFSLPLVLSLSFFSLVILITVSHAAKYSGKIGLMLTVNHICKMSSEELCPQAFIYKLICSFWNHRAFCTTTDPQMNRRTKANSSFQLQERTVMSTTMSMLR